MHYTCTFGCSLCNEMLLGYAFPQNSFRVGELEGEIMMRGHVTRTVNKTYFVLEGRSCSLALRRQRMQQKNKATHLYSQL